MNKKNYPDYSLYPIDKGYNKRYNENIFNNDDFVIAALEYLYSRNNGLPSFEERSYREKAAEANKAMRELQNAFRDSQYVDFNVER